MAKILVVGMHYPVCSARYISDAFTRLGHDVRHVGEAMGNKIWGMETDPKYNWEPDANKTSRFLGWPPDLVVISESAYPFHHPVYDNTPHVVFGMDNHVMQYLQSGVAHYFLAHRTGPVHPVCDCDDHTWIKCAYDPAAFTPSPIPMHERAYDVAVIGVPYERRIRILAAMAEAGLKVYANTGLLYDEYRDVYHNARISLCVSAAGDVAQRIFETAAMGCLVLTDNCADFEALGFRSGHEGMIFTYDEEAVQLAKGLIVAAKELKRIASEGQAWARPHTWEARAQTILDTMGLK